MELGERATEMKKNAEKQQDSHQEPQRWTKVHKPHKDKDREKPRAKKGPSRPGSRPQRQAKDLGDKGSSWTQRAPRKMERGPQEQKALLRHGEWPMVTGEDHGPEKRTTETGTRAHITETRRRAKKSGRGSRKWREAHRHQKTHKGRMWTQKAH